MATRAKPIPEGFHTATPYLIIDGASRAIEFYKKAFGATELTRMADPTGKIRHAEIKIGNSPFMTALRRFWMPGSGSEEVNEMSCERTEGMLRVMRSRAMASDR